MRALKSLEFRVGVDAPIDNVWSVISTVDGLKTYLSPDLFVEPEVGGAFEIYFDTSMPQGQQGSEEMKILALEPYRMGFTWNNPPTLPSIRDQRTAVYLELVPAADHTLIELYHLGFGHGGDWDKAYEYFARAWGKIVLPRLVYAVEVGPFPWKEDPGLEGFQNRVQVNA